MDGKTLIKGDLFFSSARVSPAAGLGFGAAVDFDGDGVTDIHWNYSLQPVSSGTTFITLMRGDVDINWQDGQGGDAIKRYSNIPFAPPPWEAVGAGDFTGDGKPDLFLAQSCNRSKCY